MDLGCPRHKKMGHNQRGTLTRLVLLLLSSILHEESPRNKEDRMTDNDKDR